MTDSRAQLWSDAVAMVLAIINDDAPRYAEIMRGYSHQLTDDDPLLVEYPIVSIMMTLMSTLLDATAEYLEMDAEELGNFLLMEQFKQDLFGEEG